MRREDTILYYSPLASPLQHLRASGNSPLRGRTEEDPPLRLSPSGVAKSDCLGAFAAFVAAAAGGLHDTHTSALASTLASQRKLSENQGNDCRKSQIEREQSGDIPDRNAHNFVEAFF